MYAYTMRDIIYQLNCLQTCIAVAWLNFMAKPKNIHV